MLPVGSGCHAPIALVILHEHTHGDSLAALVLERDIEKFARILKVRVHCRRQFGELGLDCNVDGKVDSGVVDNNIVIVPLTAVIHEQDNHFTLSVIAYLCVVGIGGVIYKRTSCYLCHILHVLVTLELGYDIVRHNALRGHEAILAECDVTVVQYSIGRILLLAQLVDEEVIDELTCNRQAGIVECRFGPRETRVECREIGCIETVVLDKAGTAAIAVVYICYIVE